jgi:manganese-dependent inorganic pyrophosphatase
LSAAVLLEQSTPVDSVMQPDPHAVTPDDLLGEAQQHLRQGRLSALPVVEADGRYVGLLLRRHLVPQRRRRVILTDHNHAGQAAAGVTESDMLAIIDHHNLGGLQTLQPLVMHIEPVGCTCTLIAEMYQRAGIVPTCQIAGAMLGAILSDTVQFRSPTTTPRDRTAAEWLSAQSGEQIETLARSMFRARLPNPTPLPEWWVSRDRKVYSFGDTTIGIAQIELVDVEQVMPPVDALRRALAEAARHEQLTTAFLLLTDILEQRSLLLAADETGEQIAEQAFGGRFANGTLALPGVMSRKSQVVPPLAGALVG